MVVVTHGVWSHPVQSGRILVVVRIACYCSLERRERANLVLLRLPFIVLSANNVYPTTLHDARIETNVT